MIATKEKSHSASLAARPVGRAKGLDGPSSQSYHGGADRASPGVREERTHWRDELIGLRHRGYGFDCPCVDIDFLLCEYSDGKPSALIEHKLGTPRSFEYGHPSYRAIRSLADASNIPFFIAFYNPVFFFYTVFPMNTCALDWVPDGGQEFSEHQYVTMLYAIRGREIPESVAIRLNQVTPAEVR